MMQNKAWINCRIGDIAIYINGRAFKPTEWEETGKPIIRIQNLNNPKASYNYSTIEFDDKYKVKHGDLLFAWSASLGAYIWHGQEALLNQHIFKVIPFKGVEKRFIYYLLQYITAQLYAKSHGSGMVHITKGKFENSLISLAPLNEQHRIVTKIEELFSKIDKGVESLQKAKELLVLYRQSLLKHAFEGKLTEQWRKENPDKVVPTDELLEQIKQARESLYQKQLEEWESEGKKGKKPSKPFRFNSASLIKTEELNGLLNLPQDWLYVRLSEVAEIGSGQALSKSKKLGDPIEVSYLRVANVQRGKLVLDEIKTMQIERCQLKKLELKQWDILFNEGGDRDKLGRGWIWESQIIPCITQNHVFRATPYLESEAFSKLISHWGNSFGQQYFDAEGKQTTNLASINKTVLSNFPVPLLSKTEQIEIISQIDSCLSVIDKLDNDIELYCKRS